MMAGAAALLAPARAWAADEEIQVYTADILPRGGVGLDIHTNYVATGDLSVDYPGQQPSLHRFRVTPEFAYGLTNTIELGAYLPLAEIDGRGRFGIDGIKLRIKYIHPHADQGWYWGANFEIGRVSHKLDENPYNAELKGIIGFERGRWSAALNTNIDFKVAGPAPAPAALQIATQLFYALGKRTSVGVETYNGVGEFRALGRLGSSDQTSFVAINQAFGRWDLNLGVGRGYGSNPDRLIVKAIIGVPIGRPHR